MHKAVKTYQPYVVFSQWKRKGYAILASLGKLIKIGHLSVPIVEKASLKNDISPAYPWYENGTDRLLSEEEEGPPGSTWQNLLYLLLLLAGLIYCLPVQTMMRTSSCDQPSSSKISHKITAPLGWNRFHIPKGLFILPKSINYGP